jgi:large subunit ribosomal protein L10
MAFASPAKQRPFSFPEFDGVPGAAGCPIELGSLRQKEVEGLAITKEKKAELREVYRQLASKSQGMILVEYRGMDMEAMDPVRRKVREAQGELHVVKNTLARDLLKEMGHQVSDDFFKQTTAVAFAFSDPPAVAKALTTVAKTSEFLKVKGGFIGPTAMTIKQVEALADLPPLPVVRAQLLGVISAPATRIAGALASSVRQVVNVVKAYSEKEAEAAAAA